MRRAALIILVGILSGVVPARADLLGYYPLNGSFADASGHGNDGTPGPDAPKFGPGRIGRAGDLGAVFSGNDASQYFTVPIDLNPYDQVTFGAWIKPTATDPVRGIISNDTGGYGRTIDIDSRAGNTGYSAFSGSGVFGAATPTGGFDFVAVVYDRKAATEALYVNAGLKYTATGVPPNGDPVLTIGRNPHFDQPFGGTIDDLFVFGQALSDADIANVMQKGVLGSGLCMFPGDANGDGKVNFSDLLVLAQHYGVKTGQTCSTGDFNSDGGVGFDDLLILAQHYGQTAAMSPSTSAAVPEPSCLVVALGWCPMLRRRRRPGGGRCSAVLLGFFMRASG